MNCEPPMEEKNADCTKNLLNAAERKRRILQELQDPVTQHKNGSQQQNGINDPAKFFLLHNYRLPFH